MKYWRHHRIRGWREYGALFAFMLVAFACGAVLLGFSLVQPKPVQFGVTYSTVYANALGLDAQAAFADILENLTVKHVRIPVYWTEIETSPGVYDFTQLDALLEKATAKNVPVTLAIGMKVPRWPECFIPSFYARDSASVLDAAVLRYVQEIVTHAKQYNIITRWQVENEPLFPYGDCPPISLERLVREVELVRALDTRPIVMTVSGEQEAWMRVASYADVIGVSMYRFAYQNRLGPIAFPHTPMYYRLHAFVTRFFVKDIMVSELQMEPWFTGNPQNISSIDVPFTHSDFVEHLAFANTSGFSEVLLWGVEWWYYQHIQGNDALWNAARDTFLNDSLE